MEVKRRPSTGVKGLDKVVGAGKYSGESDLIRAFRVLIEGGSATEKDLEEVLENYRVTHEKDRRE